LKLKSHCNGVVAADILTFTVLTALLPGELETASSRMSLIWILATNDGGGGNDWRSRYAKSTGGTKGPTFLSSTTSGGTPTICCLLSD